MRFSIAVAASWRLWTIASISRVMRSRSCAGASSRAAACSSAAAMTRAAYRLAAPHRVRASSSAATQDRRSDRSSSLMRSISPRAPACCCSRSAISASSRSHSVAAPSSAARTASGSNPPSTVLNVRSRTPVATADITFSICTAGLIGGRSGRLHRSPGTPSVRRANMSRLFRRSRFPRSHNHVSKLLVASCLGVFLALAGAAPASAQIDARMFRYPDVSASRITFVYGGDIWVVPKTGGIAIRLSSPPGEELFPRFSPDGSKIAYSANYDGNLDVYVVPTVGGEPVRLTHHPMDDRVVGWHPDGKRVLFASSRASGRQRFNQFYLVNVTGGLPERLPVPYGEFGAFSPDGARFAYMPQSQDFRTWKRYRGGWAPDIWIFDLKTLASRNVTNNDASDAHPMWHGGTMYFMSDRGADQRQNIWAWNEATGAVRQVTD